MFDHAERVVRRSTKTESPPYHVIFSTFAGKEPGSFTIVSTQPTFKYVKAGSLKGSEVAPWQCDSSDRKYKSQLEEWFKRKIPSESVLGISLAPGAYHMAGSKGELQTRIAECVEKEKKWLRSHKGNDPTVWVWDSDGEPRRAEDTDFKAGESEGSCSVM